MTPDESDYSLSKLAAASGATPRTIRYYIAQGLLPAPFGGGPATRYRQGHIDRLRLIRTLQRRHLPLAEIRARLEGLSDGDVAALVAREPEGPPQPDSAIEYIRGLLPSIQSPPARVPAQQPPRSRPAAAPAAAALMLAPPQPVQSVVRESIAAYDASSPASVAGGSFPQPSRSQWERISLDPDIELHVRRPLSRHQNRAVERLLTFARQVLEEDPS